MKIRPEHYAEVRDAIADLPREAVAAHKVALLEDPRVKDLGMRFRWDLLHATRRSAWICDELYPYMNDSHIDTALRSIVQELAL